MNPIDHLKKSNDAKRIEDLNNLKSSLEDYYKRSGRYPSGRNGLINNNDWGRGWDNGRLPIDPQSPERTYYYYSEPTNGQSYRLYASLETDDEKLCKEDGSTCSGASSISAKCGTIPEAICNYGVTSQNISP